MFKLLNLVLVFRNKVFLTMLFFFFLRFNYAIVCPRLFIICVRTPFGSLTQRINELKPKKPNTKNL